MRSSSGSRAVAYAFRCFDVNAGCVLAPPFKAILRAIEQTFHGQQLSLSAEWVDAWDLDAEGRWFRLATGWGE